MDIVAQAVAVVRAAERRRRWEAFVRGHWLLIVGLFFVALAVSLVVIDGVTAKRVSGPVASPGAQGVPVEGTEVSQDGQDD